MNLPANFTGLAPPDAAGRRYYYVKGVRTSRQGGDAAGAPKPFTGTGTPDYPVSKSIGKPGEKVTGKQGDESAQIPTGILEPSIPPPDPTITPINGKLKFDPRFHLNKAQQKYIAGILGGVGTWKLRKVTEKDVAALDNLAQQLRDPVQWRAVNSITNKVDNAAKVGGYAYIPVGKIKARGGKIIKPQASTAPAPAVTPKPKKQERKGVQHFDKLDLGPGGLANLANAKLTPDSPSALGWSAEATGTTGVPSVDRKGDKGKRGVENTKPVGEQTGAKKTFSILSHRSPKVKETDRALKPGEAVYANIIHNQTAQVTPEEYKTLGDNLHRLDRDKINRLYKRFGIPRDTDQLKTLKQLRKGIKDHIADLQEKGAGPEQVPGVLGEDRRSGKHQKDQFTQFRPIK
jgi:hypothetical protein